jgi:hypothetical protein
VTADRMKGRDKKAQQLREYPVPLHLSLNRVGRLPDNDVVIRDECVSRRHCAFLAHNDQRRNRHSACRTARVASEPGQKGRAVRDG